MPRPSEAELDEVRAMFAELRAVVAAMHAGGVELLVGTDAAGPRIPGFTVHDELQLLVEAGLSPGQALVAATARPAQVLGRTDVGRVAPGQIADLVVLDANPLNDIRSTTRIRGVVLAGRWMDRSALDALLREGEALASTF
jgi:imidazolonepropionase-like amidohydrolase